MLHSSLQWMLCFPFHRSIFLMFDMPLPTGATPLSGRAQPPENLPPRRALLGPRYVRVDSEKDKDYALLKRFFRSLSRGIFFAFPMRPCVTQALFGIKGKRKNESKNPAAPAASVSFTLRECFLSIGIYLLLGICAYSVLMEHWSLVDAVVGYSIVTFMHVRVS